MFFAWNVSASFFNRIARYDSQKKIEIFLANFHKSLARRFLKVIYKQERAHEFSWTLSCCCYVYCGYSLENLFNPFSSVFTKWWVFYEEIDGGRGV